MGIAPTVLLLFLLIGVNAFFAMSEFAIVSINTQKMKHLAEDGNKAAEKLLLPMLTEFITLLTPGPDTK